VNRLDHLEMVPTRRFARPIIRRALSGPSSRGRGRPP
jgi:hypothetical protein